MEQEQERLIELEIPRKADYVVIARLISGALSRMTELDYEAIDDIKLAVSESCTTLIKSPAGDSSEAISLSFTLAEHEIGISIQDKSFMPSGSPAGKSAGTESEDEEEQMRISLIASLVDDVSYESSDDLRRILLRKKAGSLIAADEPDR